MASGVFRQAGRQHGARRAPADDQEIVLHRDSPCDCVMRRPRTSVGPPAGHGMTSRIGLLEKGACWATGDRLDAIQAKGQEATFALTLDRMFMVISVVGAGTRLKCAA